MARSEQTRNRAAIEGHPCGDTVWHRVNGAHACRLSAAALAVLSLSGCLSPGDALTAREEAVVAAARPILTLDPGCVWSECYNRLVGLGETSSAYLVRQPVMCHPVAPDDLRVMLHTSLLRLLADPYTAPRLSATCFETTLGVLHFDLKVRGRRIGTPFLPVRGVPSTWHELYPTGFDHIAAAEIDAEADRRSMQQWWAEHAAQPSTLVTTCRLQPRTDDLWRLLARRYADRWTWQPEETVLLCAGPSEEAVLLRGATYDYNLVRAACVWLGSSKDPAVQDRLIELVGSPVPVVSYNARFALRYSPNDRMRRLIEEYQGTGTPADAGDRSGSVFERPREL